MAVATAGGLGYAPVASGTIGSLLAVPFLPSLARLRVDSGPLYAAAVLGVIALAVWAAGRAEAILGGHDHSYIVIDEVAGLVLASVFLPASWTAAFLAFLYFRVFDVLKPPPAGWIDRSWHGGTGVVGDDLVAGLYAGAVTWLTLRFL